eukprot:GHVP01013282.1.p1 GENE.GHVP01013282.1~~GHVP01013282.1.p1  ORF type:complete len:216 (-),score=38.35 GHVP01013282.1:148-795(-)
MEDDIFKQANDIFSKDKISEKSERNMYKMLEKESLDNLRSFMQSKSYDDLLTETTRLLLEPLKATSIRKIEWTSAIMFLLVANCLENDIKKIQKLLDCLSITYADDIRPGKVFSSFLARKRKLVGIDKKNKVRQNKETINMFYDSVYGQNMNYTDQVKNKTNDVKEQKKEKKIGTPSQLLVSNPLSQNNKITDKSRAKRVPKVLLVSPETSEAEE